MRLFLIMLLLPFVAAADVDLVIDGKSVEDGRVEITTGDSGNDGGTTDPEPDPVPDQCSGVTTPRDTSSGTYGFPTVFNQFPANSGTSIKFRIASGHYRAARFTAPAGSTYGNFDIIGGTHAPGGQLLVAVSKCPGDFSQTIPSSNCRAAKASHQFWWSTASYAYVCNLNPGEQYYLNMKFTNCSSSYCGAVFTWRR